MPALPRLDEYAVTVAAGVDDLWPALLETLDGGLSRPLLPAATQVLGCADRAASGPRPLAVGSTVPGFRVTEAVPGRTLVLTGRHRFSAYALTFRLEPDGAGRSRLRAETRAAFPGPAGAVYRLLVIGTGGHGVAVRRWLTGVAGRAERRARTRTTPPD